MNYMIVLKSQTIWSNYVLVGSYHANVKRKYGQGIVAHHLIGPMNPTSVLKYFHYPFLTLFINKSKESSSTTQ